MDIAELNVPNMFKSHQLRKNCLYSEFFLVRIQSECGKIRAWKTPNTDTFHAMVPNIIWESLYTFSIDCVFAELTVWRAINPLDRYKLWILTQSAFTCSKLIIETLEQGVKYVQS